jgi:hypothetical protein
MQRGLRHISKVREGCTCCAGDPWIGFPYPRILSLAGAGPLGLDDTCCAHWDAAADAYIDPSAQTSLDGLPGHFACK